MLWPVADVHQLAILIAELGDCFVVRRTLQRLERGEIDVTAAIERLKTHAEEMSRQT